MPRTLYVDIETYSSVDLTSSGVYRYVEAPDFEILMAAWALDDGPVELAVGLQAIIAIPGLLDSRIEKVAHNAQFERVCFSAALEFPVGEYLDPNEYRDTMAAAAEHGYPRKLGALAAALGGEQKDEAGTRLIKMFCIPNKNGERTRPEEKPEDWEQFKAYCIQDVVTLRDVDKSLDPLTPMETRVWVADQTINDRGVQVDTEMARFAVDAAATNRMVQELRITQLTGVDNPGSGTQMIKWLRESGLEVSNMQAETIQKLLAQDLDDVQREVLELRVELALVASKKYSAALGYVSSDGRLRGGFRFFGAHTGRWAGSGVQMHNLPRAAMDSPTEAEAAICDLKMGLGADAHTLKALVRSLFIGPFVVVDYAAIEARVVSWLADEGWALQAFKDGRDIYVETAERMGGLTRFQGKVAVLALGYNGGIGSLSAMGAQGSNKELQFLVDQWRAANPAIVDLWATMENRFRLGGPVGDRLCIEVDNETRRMRLPSGRAITYHGCKWEWKEDRWGRRRRMASFIDPRGVRVDTYGGRLIENATQAVARDVMAEALVELNDWGFSVVGHVHDEILVEAREEDLDDIKKLMLKSPSWGEGLPLDGEGFACARYRKG